MDRGRAQARLLAAAGLLLLGVGAAAPPGLPIREARWLTSPDVVADLTTEPGECLPPNAARRPSVATGRLLFRSPLLLGGQAARAGLSCASCHRNGRSNPRFHFPGISGDPGTADVTASIMSEHRGDGVFNPKPIPDLGGDPAKLKVKGTPKLRDFVHGLITQEFDGPEPSPAALDAVVAYVTALDPAACRKESPITLDVRLDEVETAVTLARQAYDRGDPATGRALLAAARSTLGAIDERFQIAGLERARRELHSASAVLFSLQNAGSAGPWGNWERNWRAHKRALQAAEPRSLYNPKALRTMVSRG